MASISPVLSSSNVASISPNARSTVSLVPKAQPQSASPSVIVNLTQSAEKANAANRAGISTSSSSAISTLESPRATTSDTTAVSPAFARKLEEEVASAAIRIAQTSVNEKAAAVASAENVEQIVTAKRTADVLNSLISNSLEFPAVPEQSVIPPTQVTLPLVAPVTPSLAEDIAASQTQLAAVVAEDAANMARALQFDANAHAIANITRNPSYADAVADYQKGRAMIRGIEPSALDFPNEIIAVQPIPTIAPVAAIDPVAGNRAAT